MIKKAANETMTTELISINWGDQMETAHKRMTRHKLRHLPVTNDQGEIIGMLSDRDVQRSMISEIKHDGTGNLRSLMSSESIEFDPESKVKDYMGWPILTVDQNTDLQVVATRMLNEKISSLLVQDGKKIVGILTTDDMLKVLVDLLSDPKTPIRWTLKTMLADGAHRFDGILI